MKNYDWNALWVSFFISIFCLIGFMFGRDTKEGEYQKVAISKGYAQYNPTNGIFEWKTLDK